MRAALASWAVWLLAFAALAHPAAASAGLARPPPRNPFAAPAVAPKSLPAEIRRLNVLGGLDALEGSGPLRRPSAVKRPPKVVAADEPTTGALFTRVNFFGVNDCPEIGTEVGNFTFSVQAVLYPGYDCSAVATERLDWLGEEFSNGTCNPRFPWDPVRFPGSMLDFCYEGATGLPVSTNRVVGWHLSPTVPEALMQHNETSTIYYGSCTPEQTFDAEITWFSADVWNNTAVSPKATSNCNEDFGKAVCIGGFDFPELSSCGALAQSEILVGALSTTTTFTTTTRTTQTATTSATATPELKFIFHTIFYQSTWDCPDFDSLFNGTDVAETVTFRSGVTDQEGCILEDGTDLLTAPRTCRSRFPFITWATIQWCVEVPSFPVSPEGIAGYLIDGPIPQRIWEYPRVFSDLRALGGNAGTPDCPPNSYRPDNIQVTDIWFFPQSSNTFNFFVRSFLPSSNLCGTADAFGCRTFPEDSEGPGFTWLRSCGPLSNIQNKVLPLESARTRTATTTATETQTTVPCQTVTETSSLTVTSTSLSTTTATVLTTTTVLSTSTLSLFQPTTVISTSLVPTTVTSTSVVQVPSTLTSVSTLVETLKLTETKFATVTKSFFKKTIFRTATTKVTVFKTVKVTSTKTLKVVKVTKTVTLVKRRR